MRHRFTAALLTIAMGAGLLAVGAPEANAGSKGRKNTAIGLGALAAYQLLRGKTGTGLIAGAGAAYAYERYRDARKNERRYDRYNRSYSAPYRYSSGNGGYYPAGYSNGYRQYSGSGSGSYVTDEWGNRRYYKPRHGDGNHRYDGRRYRRAGYVSRYDIENGSSRYATNNTYCPPGSSRGKKRGWRKR